MMLDKPATDPTDGSLGCRKYPIAALEIHQKHRQTVI